MCRYIDTYINRYMYIYTYIHARTSGYAYGFILIHIYRSMYIYIHTYIHTLHYITLHYITLHYITCITYIHTWRLVVTCVAFLVPRSTTAESVTRESAPGGQQNTNNWWLHEGPTTKQTNSADSVKQCKKTCKIISEIRSALVPWSALVCPGLPCLPCLPWSALVCPGLSWSALVCVGVPKRALVCLGLPRSALVCPGLPWSTLVGSGPP